MENVVVIEQDGAEIYRGPGSAPPEVIGPGPFSVVRSLTDEEMAILRHALARQV
jgi:hypothetical protein